MFHRKWVDYITNEESLAGAKGLSRTVRITYPRPARNNSDTQGTLKDFNSSEARLYSSSKYLLTAREPWGHRGGS